MTIREIKEAVDNGKKVNWVHSGYEVIKDDIGQYLIRCKVNGSCIGLTDKFGKNLNGHGVEFFIREENDV